MTFFDDLSAYRYYETEENLTINNDWLSSSHEFNKGNISRKTTKIM